MIENEGVMAISGADKPRQYWIGLLCHVTGKHIYTEPSPTQSTNFVRLRFPQPFPEAIIISTPNKMRSGRSFHILFRQFAATHVAHDEGGLFEEC